LLALSIVRRDTFAGHSEDSMIATQDDIRHCFRLLLGRAPNAEEWPGYSARAGQPLADIVRSFANSAECAERGLFAHELDDSDVRFIDVFGKVVAAKASDIDVGRDIAAGLHEPHITALFRNRLKPGMTFVDVGANSGYFTSLALACVGIHGSVYAVEPNPDNIQLIEMACRINDPRNLKIMAAAAGAEFGTVRLRASGSNGSVSNKGKGGRIVAQVMLDGLLQGAEFVDFIKIDVEGYEHEVLLGAGNTLEEHRPWIVFKFAPNGLAYGAKGIDLISDLLRHRYRIGAIAKDGTVGPLSINADELLRAHAESGVDQIDLYAEPL
jgi:FkbM family methyltransferase